MVIEKSGLVFGGRRWWFEEVTVSGRPWTYPYAIVVEVQAR